MRLRWATPVSPPLWACAALTLEPILARHALSVAIVDDVDSFVVGGPRTALEAACEEAAARGASAPSGCRSPCRRTPPLLREAMEHFHGVLRESSPRAAARVGYRLLSRDRRRYNRRRRNRDRQAGCPSDLDHHRLGCVPCELPIGRRKGGVGTRSWNGVEPHGVGTVSRRQRPLRSGRIPHIGRTADVAATGDGLARQRKRSRLLSLLEAECESGSRCLRPIASALDQGRRASFASTLKVQRSAVASVSGRPWRVRPMSQWWVEDRVETERRAR